MSRTDKTLTLVGRLLDKWDELPNDVTGEPEFEPVAEVMSQIKNIVDDEQESPEEFENSEKVRALELAILNIKDVVLKEIKLHREDVREIGVPEIAFMNGLIQASNLIDFACRTLCLDDRYKDGFLHQIISKE